MTLHLIKLCVGVESIQSLAQWQKRRLTELKKKGRPLQLVHVTRQTPKRADELLDGGSLYWVIRGSIAVRQRHIQACSVTQDPTGNRDPGCLQAYRSGCSGKQVVHGNRAGRGAR